MTVTFQKATKSQAKARVAVTGPAGAGKTFTALRLATGMGGRIALIDTEHGSASKYVQGERNGRKTVEKLGMAPVTRDGMEFEFDIVLDVDINHTGVVSKSRASSLADSVHKKPGEELAAQIKAWLSDGVVDSGVAGSSGVQPTSAPAPSAPAAATVAETPITGEPIADLAALYDLAIALPDRKKTRPEVNAMVTEHGYEKTLRTIQNQHRMQCGGAACAHIARFVEVSASA